MEHGFPAQPRINRTTTGTRTTPTHLIRYTPYPIRHTLCAKPYTLNPKPCTGNPTTGSDQQPHPLPRITTWFAGRIPAFRNKQALLSGGLWRNTYSELPISVTKACYRHHYRSRVTRVRHIKAYPFAPTHSWINMEYRHVQGHVSEKIGRAACNLQLYCPPFFLIEHRVPVRNYGPGNWKPCLLRLHMDSTSNCGGRERLSGVLRCASGSDPEKYSADNSDSDKWKKKNRCPRLSCHTVRSI
jgi:hypothetical protein